MASSPRPAPARTRSLNLGGAYPIGGMFLGALGGSWLGDALRAMGVVTRSWLREVAFRVGPGDIDNLAALTIFGGMAGVTWGIAWWFIKDRRDALRSPQKAR